MIRTGSLQVLHGINSLREYSSTPVTRISHSISNSMVWLDKNFTTTFAETLMPWGIQIIGVALIRGPLPTLVLIFQDLVFRTEQGYLEIRVLTRGLYRM